MLRGLLAQSSSRRRLLRSSLTMVMLVVVVGLYDHTMKPMLRDAVHIDIPREARQLGTRWSYDNVTCVLPIRNLSTCDIRVDSLSASCACTHIAPTSFILGSGKERPISLTMNLSTTTLAREAFLVTLLASAAPVYSADRGETRQFSWPLRGHVRSPVHSLSPAGLDIRRDEFGLPPRALTFPVAVIFHEPIAHLSAASKLNGVSVESISPDATDMRKWSLILSISPDVTPDTDDAQLRISGSSFDGSRFTDLPLSFPTTVKYDVDMTPSRLIVGPLTIGTEFQERIRFRSHSGRPFSLTVLQAPSNVHVGPQVAIEESTTVITACIRAVASGSRAVSIRFGIKESGSQQCYPLILDCIYQGI